MNDLQIDYFLAVAKHLSFTKAAEELYVSQPAISRQIADMERELGCTLFDRTNKQIELTEAGKLFWEFYLNYRTGLNQMVRKVKALHEQARETVCLGCLKNWDLSGFFLQLLDTLEKKHPYLKIDLKSYGMNQLGFALKRNKADVILTLEDCIKGVEGISSQILTEIPLLILYTAHHPLARLDQLTPSDFKDEVFLVVSKDEGIRAENSVKNYCNAYGFEPRIQIVPDIETMMMGVQSGLGVAIFDSWVRDRMNHTFKYTETDTLQRICLAWNKDNVRPAVEILIDELKGIFQNRGEEKENPLL